MTFLHPEFLYFMLPPLFILFALLLTQKESQAAFFSDEVMEKLRVSSNTLTLKARNALFFVMGVLLVVALADPVIKEGKIEVKAKSADIMVALDISDSMLASDVYPNRLQSAKQKAMEFLKMAQSDRVGVIAFAKNSYLVSPLSFDKGVVGFLLSSLNTKSITEKGTDFLNMLDVFKKASSGKNRKYLFILSDGGDDKDFSKEIAAAKADEITVFVLGIGTAKGAPVKLEDGSFITKDSKIMISKLNDNIASLATKTGGVYIQNTTSDEDIKAMFHEIERISDKKELKAKEIERYIPLFYYPLALAMLILLIATSSMSKRVEVKVPSMFILFTLLTFTPHAKAGVLDFLELDEAKKAYENKEYKKSAKLYEQYAEKTKNSQGYYNAGNSLYKQGKYKEALDAYSRAAFADKNQRAANFANMGNAHAKLQKTQELQKALKSYEESLKLKEDKDVRENYETIKKLLEQQKKKQNQDSKNNNNDKDKKDNKNKDSKKEQNKDQNSKDGENKDQKNNQSSKENQKKKEDSKKQNEKNKNEQQKQQQQQNKENKQKQSHENNASKQQQKQNSDLQELKDKKKDETKSSSQAQAHPQQMSEAEEQKWLNKLGTNNSSYMYMLGKENHKEADSNEIPW